MSSNLQINGGITTIDASTRNRNNEDRYEAWWNHRGTNWLNEFFVARDAAANGQIPNVAGSILSWSHMPSRCSPG